MRWPKRKPRTLFDAEAAVPKPVPASTADPNLPRKDEEAHETSQEDV